jgi:outer membrane protein TolC
MPSRLLWSSTLSLVFLAPLDAQAPARNDSVLARLTAEVLTANPRVTGAAAQARAASERVRPAGALPDPGLSVTMMDLTLPRFSATESDFTEFDVEVSQEFPWPGTLGSRTRAARADLRGRETRLEATRREIVVETARLYYRLRYLAEARRILGRQQRLLESAAEIATSRYATGRVAQGDPLFARSAHARLDSELAAYAGEEAATRADLAALRGMTEPDPVSVAPLGADAIAALLPALETFPAEAAPALSAHPRLEAQRAGIEAAVATAETERLTARPDVAIMVRYGARPIASDFFSVGLGFRLPIWAGRKQNRLAAAARAEVEAGRAGLADEAARITAEYGAMLARARAGGVRLRTLLDRVLPLVNATAEAALREYRVGQVDFGTVLGAEDSRYRVELEAAEVAAENLVRLVMLEQLTLGERNP